MNKNDLRVPELSKIIIILFCSFCLCYATPNKALDIIKLVSIFFLPNQQFRPLLPGNFQKNLKIGLRACEIPRSVSKTVNNFFHYGLHLRPKISNTCSGDDVRRTCCYFLGCKCKQW